jgi:hypothetical protein
LLYGHCLSEGRGVPIDLVLGAKYLKLAADQNIAVGQFRYGQCLSEGRGVPIDLVLGAKYFKLAADQNLADAQASFGSLLEFGIGIDPDLPKAVEFYRRAAAGGSVHGLTSLGLCLEFGKGVSKSLSEAAENYKAAADRGHARAQSNYGFCLQHGLGVGLDLVEAARYYKMSADQGHDRSAYQYALCLHYGLGVEVDLDDAAKYYELAAAPHRIYFISHSYRCLRSENKAPSAREQFSEKDGYHIEVLERSMAVRPLTPSTSISDRLSNPLRSNRSVLIGAGGSSKVILEIDSTTDQKVAVKQIQALCLDHIINRTMFIREIEILAMLNHPCILRILGWSLPTPNTLGEIRTEYAPNGSLKSVLTRGSGSTNFWNPTGKGIIICRIVLGMRCVHSHGILHRDLKPSNILLNDFGYPLIGDFGASRYENDDATPTGEAGTLYYAAPEMFKEEIPTTKVDVFSFGLILYEILVGSPVFPLSMAPFAIMRCILSSDMPEIPASCGEMMQELIKRCWSMNPAARPSFDEIFAESQANNFDIVPGANSNTVRDYARGILAWEARSALAKQERKNREASDE